RLTIEYLRPAFYGEDVTVETWVSEMGHATAHREYRVRRGAEVLARARSQWTYLDVARGRPVRTTAERIPGVQAFGTPALTDLAGKGDPPFRDRRPRVFHNRRRVQRHELDPLQHVNNAVYLQWLEHAVGEALAEAGHSYTSLRERGSAIYQRRQA